MYKLSKYFSRSERKFRKVRRFYKHPEDVETWILDLLLLEFLVPRLKLFLEDSGKIIDWEANEHGRKLLEYIPIIIEDFQYYIDNYDTNDLDVWYSMQDKVSKGFKLLSEIYIHLGW